MSSSEKWNDLTVRMGSGAVMVVIGLGAVWLGGHWFHILISLVCGVMMWELVRMLEPQHESLAKGMGALAGGAVLLASYLPPGFALPLLMAPAFVAVGQMQQRRTTFMIYSVVTLLAGYGMIGVRDDFGLKWMLWLVSVVVITDVAGYFAGRLLGGPKFWPKVSPKKTWSGTVAGWIGAGIVGALFAANTEAGFQLIGVSIAVSMASQMGDIAESAMKRKAGVKDSSALIPGHGGVLDRFDGMLGGSLLLLIVGQFLAFPPVV